MPARGFKKTRPSWWQTGSPRRRRAPQPRPPRPRPSTNNQRRQRLGLQRWWTRTASTKVKTQRQSRTTVEDMETCCWWRCWTSFRVIAGWKRYLFWTSTWKQSTWVWMIWRSPCWWSWQVRCVRIGAAWIRGEASCLGNTLFPSPFFWPWCGTWTQSCLCTSARGCLMRRSFASWRTTSPMLCCWIHSTLASQWSAQGATVQWSGRIGSWNSHLAKSAGCSPSATSMATCSLWTRKMKWKPCGRLKPSHGSRAQTLRSRRFCPQQLQFFGNTGAWCYCFALVYGFTAGNWQKLVKPHSLIKMFINVYRRDNTALSSHFRHLHFPGFPGVCEADGLGCATHRQTSRGRSEFRSKSWKVGSAGTCGTSRTCLYVLYVGGTSRPANDSQGLFFPCFSVLSTFDERCVLHFLTWLLKYQAFGSILVGDRQNSKLYCNYPRSCSYVRGFQWLLKPHMQLDFHPFHCPSREDRFLIWLRGEERL